MQVLITGANRGIGLELVRQLAAAGHEVIATARQPQDAEELNALSAQSEGKIEVIALDVSERSRPAAIAEELKGRPIDLLINNAGVYPHSGKLGDLDYEEARRGFEVNALGPLRLAEALLPNLRQGKTRKIANITSQMGSIEDNTSGGSYAYRMSKAALNMANKSLANDLASEGFICIVVHPGWVQTDMGGPNASITVKQSVAAMLEMILTADASYNGEFLSWNGERLPW